MSKVAVVTGATGGIGLATAKLLSENGYVVYGIARRQLQLPFNCYSCDVTDFSAMEKIFAEIFAKEGSIDVVVNNAGIGISGAVEEENAADVERLFAVNLTAPINICSIALPYLRQSKGKIVNVGSVAGAIPIPFQSCYSASKAALANFSMALSGEVKNFGVKVTCVQPGDTKTGFTAARVKFDGDGVYGSRVSKSVSRMEKDEQNGKPPESVAKVILRVVKRRNPPLVITVGGSYKFLTFLAKILPKRMMMAIVNKLYA